MSSGHLEFNHQNCVTEGTESRILRNSLLFLPFLLHLQSSPSVSNRTFAFLLSLSIHCPEIKNSKVPRFPPRISVSLKVLTFLFWVSFQLRGFADLH